MKSVTPRPPAPNAALREIAGRLKNLSYRDMESLTCALDELGVRVRNDPEKKQRSLAEALLDAADELENA